MAGVIKGIISALAILALAIGFVALNVAAAGGAAHAVPAVFAKLWHLALFGVFWLGVYAAGRLGERAIFRRGRLPPEIATALGIIAFTYAAFALCAVHLAYGWLMRAFVLTLAVAGAVVWRRDFTSWPARAKAWLENLSVSSAVLLVAVTAITFPMALAAAEPPFFWDVLTYHLAVPKVYAGAHGFVYLPYNVFASMPLGGSLFYLWPYVWDGLITANACHLAVTILAAAATYRLARHWLSQFYSAVAATFVILAPTVFTVIAGGHNDHFQMLYVAGALYFYLAAGNGADVSPRRRALAVGVLLGASLAVKYTAIAGAVAFVPLWIYDMAKKRLRPAELALLLAVAAAFVAPWLLKAFVERGNPVFPSFYSVFGGRDFTAEQARRLMIWRAHVGMGRGWLDYLLLPYRVSVQADVDYAKFFGVYVPFLLPLALLAGALFRRGGRLVAFAWTYILAWGLTVQFLRYLVGALPALAVAAAASLAAVDRMWAGWPRRVFRATVIGGSLLASVPYLAGDIISTVYGHGYLAGMSAAEYLEHRRTSYPAQEFINENLPPDAKVLLVFFSHTLYLERDAVYDSFSEASAVLIAAENAGDPGELYDTVKGWGVTHVQVNHDYEATTWPYYKPRARRVFYDFLERYGSLIYKDRWNEVYELRRPAAE